jgi:hypothetical protein
MLKVMDLVHGGRLKREQDSECIISFHPWYKLSKRKKAAHLFVNG